MLANPEYLGPIVALLAAVLVLRAPEQLPWRRLALALLAAVGLVQLTCLLWIHPQLDDWSYGASALDLGWPAAQARWYHEWSGRYTATALLSAWTVAEPSVLVYRLVVWSATALAALLAWTAWRGRREERGLATLAILGALALLVPASASAWAWLAGLANYQLGLLLSLATLLLVARAEQARRPWLLASAAAMLSALAAGCSETVAVIHGGLLAALCCLPGLRLHFAVPALVTGAAGSALVLFAPGNARRMHHVTELGRPAEAGSLPHSLGAGIGDTLELLTRLATQPVFLVLLLFLVPLMRAVRARWRQGGSWRPWLAIAVVLAAVTAAQTAAEYALGSAPPGRARNVAVGALALALIGIAPGLIPTPDVRWRRARLHLRRCWCQPGWRAVTTSAAVVLLIALHLPLRWSLRDDDLLLLGLLAVGALLLWLMARGRTQITRPRLHALLLAVAVLAAPRTWTLLDDALINGPAYDHHLRARHALMRQAPGPIVEVPPLLLERLPRSILIGDLTTGATAWPNGAYARCFGHRGVRLRY